MTRNIVSEFTMHGESGVAVRHKDFLQWLQTHQPTELGSKIIAYSWRVGGEELREDIDIGKESWRELPDASGFITFESAHVPNNCTLLDAYGKLRMRLTVPWQLTTANNPESNAPPSSFWGISEPYINPADNKRGQFGVKAWVELGGEYYFELDWHTGQFLWGKEVRF